MIVEVSSLILILLGSFLIFSAAIGCLRMPDFYTQLHACSIGDISGIALIILGMMVKFGFSVEGFKLLCLLIIMLITNPAASYALAQSAFKSGLKPKTEERIND